MKIRLKFFLVIIITLSYFNTSYSQIKFGKNGTFSNKWYKGELVLHTKDTLRGWIKFESAINGMTGFGSKTNKVLFKKSIKGKKKKYKKEEFSSFNVTKNNKKTEKYATVNTSKRKIQVLKVLTEGKVTLYEIIFRANNINFNTHTRNWENNHSYDYTNMYIKRNNEKIASNEFFANIFKNFNKTAKKYFSDCSKLVEKIDNNDFKKDGLIEIVEYYNNQCN